MNGKRMRIGMVAAVVALLAACASLAQAELTARGDLFVRFSGGIVPDALPRDVRAPISVSIGGTVKTLSGQRPPALRQIEIALNRGGRLDATGLPVCRRSEIEPSSTQEALAVCGDALVGGGRYAAEIAYPEQPPYLSRGRILAFNSVVGGHRAILAQIYAAEPVPITMIIVFHIRRPGGTFGTVLSGSIPNAVIRWGYLKRISLDLHRDYVYEGRPHSYLSATCAAPDGFPGATFPFARASMAFADGRELSSTLTRSCRVRAGR
jgi:hypothetical protein